MKKTVLPIIISVSALSCSVQNVKKDTAEINIGSYGMPQSVLATVNGVEVINGGFGSDAGVHPTRKGEFYVMTDRGPNTDFLKGKKFLTPDFSPVILHFRISSSGNIEVLNSIQLKNPKGEPITGLPNPVEQGENVEIAYDRSGKIIGTDQYGLDSEGFAAAPDGTFWVSDEYGPHIVHFSADGVELERISPFGSESQGRKLPAVFAKKRPNRGMEGLCMAADGKTLVGIMQSTMLVPDKKSVVNRTLTRILTFDTITGKTKQYLYQQEGGKSDVNSGITTVSSTEFLVIERDSEFGSKGGLKKIYRINTENATDVSGTDFNAENGFLVNGKALEQNTWEELEIAGIKPVSKRLAVDLVEKMGYPHDKLEGLVYLGNNRIAVFNDDDFGVVDDANGNPVPKMNPVTGKRDRGTMYVVEIEK